MNLNINLISDDIKEYEPHVKLAYKDMPTDYRVEGEVIFKLQAPREIWVVNQETLNDMAKGLSRIDANYKEVSKIVNDGDYDMITKDMRKHHKTAWGLYAPEDDVILVCPENVKELAMDCMKFLNYGDFDDIFTRYLRYILIHELTHSTFDRVDNQISETRLSEGLANWIPNASTDEFGRRLMAFKAIHQRFDYNYYFLMNRWNNINDLLRLMGRGEYEKALEMFYSQIRQFAEGFNMVESSGKIKVGGDFKGLMGFGSKDATVGIGGTLTYLCNFGGQAIVNEIELFDGFLHPHSLLVTNRIKNMPYYEKPYYNSEFENIYIVDKSNVDIAELIKNSTSDKITEIIDETVKTIRQERAKDS